MQPSPQRLNLPDATEAGADAGGAASAISDPVLTGIAQALRARVNAILGVVHGALRGDEPPPVTAMQQIERSAQLVLSLVDDMLDLSMVRAGRLPVDVIEFRLAEVLDDVASVVGLQAEEVGVTLRFGIGPSVPERLMGDPMRLAQVLNHLGGHAVRRLASGEVAITVYQISAASPPQAARLRFEVAASGVSSVIGGREPDVAPALAEQLAQALGGVLSVSEDVEGFRCRLDWGVGASGELERLAGGIAVSAAGGPVALEGRRLLIVDGDAAALARSAEAGRAAGLEVVAVQDGWDAMREVALATQAGRPFALALIDQQLPGMHGTMCARQLLEHAPGPAPALLMTAEGDPDALRMLLASERLAVREVLVKPVEPAALAAALGAALSAAPASPMAAARAAAPLAGLRLLLVEDNPINQEVAADVLTRAGAHVTTAGDGRQALDALAAIAFDAVVMDIEMPVMDGYDTARTIRAQPRWRELPIVAMTASVSEADKARVLAAGMNDHVGKPVEAHALIAALARLLRVATRGPLALPATARAPAAPPGDPLVGLAGIDAATGRGNTMHNDRLYRRLLLKFRDSHGSTPDRIAAAWADGDRAGARRVVHDLAGVAGTLGAMGVHAAARLLEAVCAGESEADTFPVLLEALRDELRPVMAGLQALEAD